MTNKLVNSTVVTPVQCVSKTNNPTHFRNTVAVRYVQLRKFGMALFWQRAAMITGDICDYNSLRFRESGQFSVQDQIQRVLLMRLVRDVITDIMEERAGEH